MTLLVILMMLAGFQPAARAAAGDAESHPADMTPAAEQMPELLGSTPDPLLLFDFESGTLAGWSVRTGDEPYIRVSIDEETPLSGNRSLRCQVSQWSTSVPSNEQVILRYELPEPVPISAATEISWIWWVGDRRESDGVGLRLCFGSMPSGLPLRLEWASHSNHARGSWPFSDPAQQVCRHLVTLDGTLSQRSMPEQKSTPFPWLLRAVELYFWFPYDQDAFFDDIRIGHSGTSDRVRTFAADPTPITPPATSMLVADLNGDGELDKIVGCTGNPPLIWLGRGKEAWAPADPAAIGLSAAVSLTHPTVGDLDGDGNLDLLGISGDRLMIFQGLGAAHFRQIPTPFPGNLEANPAAGLLVADVLHESGPELLIHRNIRTASTKQDSIYARTGPWRFNARPFPEPADSLEPRGYRNSVVAADIDNDHDLDLFCSNADLFLQEEGKLVCATEAWLPERGTHQAGAAFGDIDNDGDLDLFIAVDLRNHRGERTVTHNHSLLYRNEGDRFVDVSHWLSGEAHIRAGNPIFADFDLDGDLDLFFTQKRWQPVPRPPNIYLENDGTGRFSPGDPDAWLLRTPPAREVICCDADDDGDLDLLLTRQDDARVVLIKNPTRADRAIKVRLLDRHGVAHAAGAHVVLRQGNAIVGYRQSGAGNLHPGWSEAVFGCPSEGPFDLTVVFPSCPSSPLVRSGLHPGARLCIVEPAFEGRWGSYAAAIGFARQQFVRALAAWGWPLLFPLAVLYGMILSATLYAFRRRPSRVGVWPGPRARMLLLVLVAASLALAAGIAGTWPTYPTAITGGRLAVVGLVAGILLGMGISYLDSVRRRSLLGSKVDTRSAQTRLLDAIDGFSHARWLKYLGSIASLCRSLTEGADPELIRPRLAKRLQSYGEVIQPQMTQIAELLPYAGLDPQLTRIFLTDLETIAAGARMVRRDMLTEATQPRLSAPGTRRALLDLSTAAARMHETTDRIFHELGRRFRTDVRAELRAALDQTREGTPGVEIRAEIPERLPPVFALKGELSNILENLITNAAVAARGNRSELPPQVVVGAHLDGGLLIITVTDSGAGIAPEQIETLFESRTADPTQHGRGLPYARRRLRLFDGKIDVMQSTAEEGTVVAVTLRPLEVAPERQPARTPQTAPEKQPPALETRPDEQPTPSEEE